MCNNKIRENGGERNFQSQEKQKDRSSVKWFMQLIANEISSTIKPPVNYGSIGSLRRRFVYTDLRRDTESA